MKNNKKLIINIFDYLFKLLFLLFLLATYVAFGFSVNVDPFLIILLIVSIALCLCPIKESFLKKVYVIKIIFIAIQIYSLWHYSEEKNIERTGWIIAFLLFSAIIFDSVKLKVLKNK